MVDLKICLLVSLCCSDITLYCADFVSFFFVYYVVRRIAICLTELSKIRSPLDMRAYGLQSLSRLNNCSKDPCLIINHSPLFVWHGSPHMLL